MSQKAMRVGIMSKEDFKNRTMLIARGEYTPQKNEPKIWFESVQSLAQVLSTQNQALLSTIIERKPASIKELAKYSGREVSNLSRTLHTMERYGIVELRKEDRSKRPIVKARKFRVDLAI